MSDELRESLALLSRRSDARIWISKPTESRIKKFIWGRSASTGALSVERPAKNELGGAILLTRHPSEPMVNKRGLSNPRPGNDCNDVEILVCPCTIQKGDILLSTKNIAPGHGQSSYGNPLRRNLLRRRFCWPLANYCVRSRRGHLLQALTSDSTPCVDSARYRW